MIPFTVSPDGAEPFEVTATSRDVSAWERIGGGRSIGKFETNAQMSWLEEMAHLASRRQGLFTGTLAEFRAMCDVESRKKPDEDSDGDGDPTQPAR